MPENISKHVKYVYILYNNIYIINQLKSGVTPGEWEENEG